MVSFMEQAMRREYMRAIIAMMIIVNCLSITEAVEVVLQKGVAADISGDDSLQDVFPQINCVLPEGRVAACLVDGPPVQASILKKGNSVVLNHSQSPIYITWKISEDDSFKNAQLDKLVLYLVGADCNVMDHYMNHPPDFVGQLSLSVDGVVFTPISGSSAEMISPQTNPFNVITWNFEPGEIKGFKYLRIESFGYKKQCCRIAEIDGWISGVNIGKSTDMSDTSISAQKINLQQAGNMSIPSQHAPEPMVVKELYFDGQQLFLKEFKNSIIDFKKLFVADNGWAIVNKKIDKKRIEVTQKHASGLLRSYTLIINENNLLSLNCRLKLLPNIDQGVSFTTTSLELDCGALLFDGITFGGIPSYTDRRPCGIEISQTNPYLIFPSKVNNVELQMFMPDWYDIKGRIKVFESSGSLVKFELFNIVRNSFEESGGIDPSTDTWHPIEGMFQPGQIFEFKINIAVFKITAPTLGLKDIESSDYKPMFWIDTAAAGQTAFGEPTITYRDKMQFIGFKLPTPIKTDKPGNSVVDPAFKFTELGMIDRLARAGVGVVVLMGDEYIDVSHGVSHEGKYDQSPPYFEELLDKLDQKGIKAVHWFSPRGFLNKDWFGRPKDQMVEQHPEWFLDAHWGGAYQTVDSYNPAPNKWIESKLAQDLTKFPKLKGFAFDTFPLRAMIRTGGSANTTLVAQDQYWLKIFGDRVHTFGDGYLTLVNATTPQYDDYLKYDYTVVEHFPCMYVNEVSGGRAPFSKTFVSHCQWQQLYGWYVTLAHMYYNFSDYDQGVGWMHSEWLGWRDKDIKEARKQIDSEVIPLWYIIGKGKRVYAAEIAPNVRQIEAVMPDGDIVVIIASVSSWSQSITVLPQMLSTGKFCGSASVDNCFNHKSFEFSGLDSNTAIKIDHLPACSIAVIKFTKVE